MNRFKKTSILFKDFLQIIRLDDDRAVVAGRSLSAARQPVNYTSHVFCPFATARYALAELLSHNSMTTTHCRSLQMTGVFSLFTRYTTAIAEGIRATRPGTFAVAFSHATRYRSWSRPVIGGLNNEIV